MTYTADTITDLLLLAEQGADYGVLSDQEVFFLRMAAGILRREEEMLDAVLEKLEAEITQRGRVLN